ncbi:MAG: DUF3365 domain-containing protein [Bacteroidia bacterium]
MRSLSAIALLLLGLAACRPASQPTALTATEQQHYLSMGQDIVGRSFSTLSSNLQAAMAAGGVTEAVSFCQLAAMPLTDSLSAAMHASIRRSSTRTRNPANAPRAHEQAMLDSFAAQFAAGETPTPQVQPLGLDSVAFYAPIMLLAPCQRCHGIPGQTIDSSDYAFIQARYPDDQATGYQAGDLRGIWSIAFAREA